jgi:hypothetical protein
MSRTLALRNADAPTLSFLTSTVAGGMSGRLLAGVGGGTGSTGFIVPFKFAQCNIFCHSEGSEESLFDLNRGEILRFAQNDKAFW